MRPFSDIIANQIISKALSPGIFLVGDVSVVLVDAMDVCVCVLRGEVCVFVNRCNRVGGGLWLQNEEAGTFNDHVPLRTYTIHTETSIQPCT